MCLGTQLFSFTGMAPSCQLDLSLSAPPYKAFRPPNLEYLCHIIVFCFHHSVITSSCFLGRWGGGVFFPEESKFQETRDLVHVEYHC